MLRSITLFTDANRAFKHPNEHSRNTRAFKRFLAIPQEQPLFFPSLTHNRHSM